jgi:hypothetical protein
MTTIVETTAGVLGATRQSWRVKSIRDLLAKIMGDNPRADEKEWLEKFVEALRSDEDYFLAAAEYAFDNALLALRKRKKAKPTAQRAGAAVAHARLVTRLDSKVTLLNLKAPNGKKLRDCRGEECRHFGGWYLRVADEVGPNRLVGEVLNEQQIRALYRA